MPHHIIQADLIVRQRLRITLSAGGIFDAGNVFVSQHRMNTGQGTRLACINITDIGIGMRTGQECTVEHAFHVDVASKNRLTFCQLFAIHFSLALTNHGF